MDSNLERAEIPAKDRTTAVLLDLLLPGPYNYGSLTTVTVGCVRALSLTMMMTLVYRRSSLEDM